jgi:hypothetical protein
MAAADLNGDGKADLVTVGFSVNVLLGTGTGSFQAPQHYAGGSAVNSSVAVADFDGDGMIDLATGHFDTGTVSVLPGIGGGTFGPPVAAAAANAPGVVAAGDFNGDGRPDLAVASFGSNDVSVLLNGGGPIGTTVRDRHVFYNDSAFDNHDPAANAADDAAVATDKLALLPGRAASFANVTSYSRGINGVMIDVANLPTGSNLTAADFALDVAGAGGAWAAAPGAPTVSARRGAGIGGSDRVTLAWNDSAVRNGWLRVSLLPTPRTGLSATDVSYFGNLVGETGDGATTFRVNAVDLAAVKLALNGAASPTARADFNRDGVVNALDLGIVKANLNRTLGAATVASEPVAPAAVPEESTPRRVWDDAEPNLLA